MDTLTAQIISKKTYNRKLEWNQPRQRARSKRQWQVREFVTQMEGWSYCGSGS